MYDEDYFKWPVLTKKAVKRVSDLMRAGNISRDDSLARELEKRIADFFGMKYALLVNNGTAAAYSAFHALGIGPQDQVIGPPYSHWASVLPAKVLGASVIFTDVEADSFNPDLQELERSINPSTKAIVVCHLYGNPVDITAVRKLCDKHKLFLLEDVSHAVGATVCRRKVGSFGDVSFFSMQASKVFVAGEGGCLVTDNYDLYAKAVELGHDKRIQELSEDRQTYIDTGLGFKFRLSAIHTAIALESFGCLEKNLAVRTAMADQFKKALQGNPDIHFPREIEAAQRVYWEQELYIDFRRQDVGAIVQAMKRQKLNAYPPNFKIIADSPHFTKGSAGRYALPHTRELVKNLIILPVLKKRKAALVRQYARTIKNILAGKSHKGRQL